MSVKCDLNEKNHIECVVFKLSKTAVLVEI
jgi:hypothetical protein